MLNVEILLVSMPRVDRIFEWTLPVEKVTEDDMTRALRFQPPLHNLNVFTEPPLVC